MKNSDAVRQLRAELAQDYDFIALLKRFSDKG